MLLTRFLFWNVQRRPLAGLVSSLISEFSVDVVVLAECDQSHSEFLSTLNDATTTPFRRRSPIDIDLRVYSRLPTRVVRPFTSDINGHLGTYRVAWPNRPELLLVTLHYHSRRNWDPGDQDQFAPEVMADVRRQERRLAHQRTIIVGDFNMNPFDRGLVAANGFHAVATRNFAAEKSRTVDGRSYDMFYNPMWRFFGDDGQAPSGTHWYRPSKPVVYGWNLYDQVLLRPSVMNGLRELAICGRAGAVPLIRDDRPDSGVASDHLPVYFSVEL